MSIKEFYAIFNEKTPNENEAKNDSFTSPITPKEKITFEKFRILNKDIFLAPQSKLLIVEKKKKKSANVIKSYPASGYKDAVQWYLEEIKKSKKKNCEFYLLVHTDEIDHECIVDHKPNP